MNQNKIRFTGIMPALITPFCSDGTVNFKTLEELIEFHLSAGVDGFYICGSSGEGVVQTVEMRKAVCRCAVSAVAGRGKVIVQTGSINPSEAFELARHAAQTGADGISSVSPSFYYHYTEHEIIDYYRKLARCSSLPVLLYAVPLVELANVRKIVGELIKVPNIIGLKDTRADFFELWRLRQLNGGCINIINGPDECLLCGLAMGADGGIGATYNIMPEMFVNLYRDFRAGNFAAAQEWQFRINKIIDVILNHAKSSCIGTIKLTLQLCGFNVGTQCYPAESFTAEETARFQAAMEQAGYDFQQRKNRLH